MGTAVKPVQVNALSALNGQAVTYSAPVGGLPPGLSVSGRPHHRHADDGGFLPGQDHGGRPVGIVDRVVPWDVSGAITMAP